MSRYSPSKLYVCKIGTVSMTALSITMEVLFVSGKDASADEGHKTDSTVKKHPATAALKPDKKYKLQKRII